MALRRSIQHFIITRFNLRSLDPESGICLDPTWLSQRFDLFERFCYPTVQTQSEQDFTWLVLFDESTPQPFRARIEQLADWPGFQAVFLPPGSRDVGRQVVGERLGTSVTPDILITTRLDNDDGLHRDFVAQVQQYSDVNVPTVLEFPNGYVWWRDRIYRDRQPSNPFTSLVEPLDRMAGRPYSTVYRGSHSDISRLGTVVVVSQRPFWVQVVHGGNLENRVRGVRVPLTALGNDFALDVHQIAMAENLASVKINAFGSALREAAFGVVRWARQLVRQFRARDAR